MEDNKKWYTSKGVWGGVAAVVAGALGIFGFATGPAFLEEAAELGVAVGGLIGGGLAIYGRLKATASLVSKK